MTTTIDATWEDVCKAKHGHVWVDRFDDGVRFLIMRGGASVCAYVGCPKDHPLAGHSYELLPLNVHGGLTFADEGDGKHFPSGFYWYGWDYGHCGDRSTYDDDPRIGIRDFGKEDTRWTPEMVDKESWTALYEFRNLMKLAETIADRAKAKS